MLRIAFCDDETEILEELESLTEQYCADRGCRMEYQTFHSPLELLAAMEKGTYFDAVFLDVLMPGRTESVRPGSFARQTRILRSFF